MTRLETVSSVAAKQRRRFLPHALIYPFPIFKLGKSGWCWCSLPLFATNKEISQECV